ncbi:MAG: IS5 family transposase, partial [Alphaproteobacteria bacterium]
FAQFSFRECGHRDSVVVKIRWGLIMAERILGQLSLADGLVAGIAQSVLDDIATVVDWPALAAVLGSRNGAGPGSPGYPSLLLLRCLLLGVWHGLSDPALEHAIKDRLSFRRFAGLSLHDPVPDHSTLWRFRMELAADGLVDRVLAEINRQLEVKGLIVKHGTLVDASLVAARARPGSKPGARGAEPGKASADPDARWGRKGKQSIFGYKIHIGVDAQHTLVRRVALTDASVTDTERGDELICGDETAVYGDQAYYTHARHARLSEGGIKDRLMRRPNKHHPKLSARHRRRNRLIGRIRSGVERPFAMLKERYGLRCMRFFAMIRNQVQTVLACCAYNLRRAATVLAPT